MEGLDIKQMITMVHSIADEKNLSEDEVMQAVEAAIARYTLAAQSGRGGFVDPFDTPTFGTDFVPNRSLC